VGPIIGVPDDVAERLAQETDLVEVDPVLADAVDALDVQLGDPPGVVLLLRETPPDGFGGLVTVIATSAYAKDAPRPFVLIVRDNDGNPHPFTGDAVNEQSIRDHLQLSYFGEPGDRRPLLRA